MGNAHPAASPKSRSQPPKTRRQVSNEDATPLSPRSSLKGNRKLISRYLKRIGKTSNHELSLDKHGFCYIPFKIFLIIIGVPDDDTGLLYFRTMIFDLHSASGISRIHKKVAAANLTAVNLGRRGSNLVMEGDEISLALEMTIKGLSYVDIWRSPWKILWRQLLKRTQNSNQ